MSAAVMTSGLFLLYSNHFSFLFFAEKPKDLFVAGENTKQTPRLYMTQGNNCKITNVLGKLPYQKFKLFKNKRLKNYMLYHTQ